MLYRKDKERPGHPPNEVVVGCNLISRDWYEMACCRKDVTTNVCVMKWDGDAIGKTCLGVPLGGDELFLRELGVRRMVNWNEMGDGPLSLGAD